MVPNLGSSKVVSMDLIVLCPKHTQHYFSFNKHNRDEETCNSVKVSAEGSQNMTDDDNRGFYQISENVKFVPLL